MVEAQALCGEFNIFYYVEREKSVWKKSDRRTSAGRTNGWPSAPQLLRKEDCILYRQIKSGCVLLSP